ncbi:Peptidase C1A, papain C-terminal [Trema orientale]|uniref:Peptidase C1A, papain C-terminal n=1 Tax=Trema orientale TaxID=63057 RepID=A0A2P5BPM9_TREOI|nr:Peptidase C1A, papain C-terminal [Trema orientale]
MHFRVLLPRSVDHRHLLRLCKFKFPVHHQRKYPTCWAYSVIACIELLYLRKYGVYKQFSVQEVIDYFTPTNALGYEMYSTYGFCPITAIKFVWSHGLSLSHHRPYIGVRPNPPRTLLENRRHIVREYFNYDMRQNDTYYRRRWITEVMKVHLARQPVVMKFMIRIMTQENLDIACKSWAMILIR